MTHPENSGQKFQRRKKTMMRKIFGVFVLMAVILAMAAPGTEAAEKKLQKTSLILNWKDMGDHSPYYVAMKKGWFAEEGIDLEVILGQGSNFSVQSVDTGKAIFGIADAPVAITARAK